MPSQAQIPDDASSGRLVSTAETALPLVATTLRVEAEGGVARVVCEQRFENRSADPMAVTYSLPLPADAAVSGFSFQIGHRRIVGEIDRTASARDRFEHAVAQGRTAALVEQDRSSLFTQELGNIPPGAEVTAEIILDQRLAWLDEGSWEWRFPTTVMPRYLGQPGRVPDADRVAQDIANAPLGTRLTLSMYVGDPLGEHIAPRSPSHTIRSTRSRAGASVELAAGSAPMDRDLVIAWRVAGQEPGAKLQVARTREGTALASDAYGLLTIVPPAAPQQTALPRDLVVLLDTSGSMGGRPLQHAVRVISALVDTLRDEDSLELIEFSHAACRWKSEPVRATPAARRDALQWLADRRAGGSTEMRDGILEALRPIRPESQRQVILVTDGAIGFENEVVAAIAQGLPATCRLHTVGVGYAVNRSLTAPAARAGRGIEIVIGLDEDPERSAARLMGRTAAPLVVGLELGGSALVATAPARLPDLFAQAPVLLGLKLRPEGGDLFVRGSTPSGEWVSTLRVEPIAQGQGAPAIPCLFARELVEDLEMECAAGRWLDDVKAQIEEAGLAFQIASRFTSWVAMTDEPTVDPSKPTRRVRMPHQLPHGVSAEGIGLGFPTLDLETRLLDLTLGVSAAPGADIRTRSFAAARDERVGATGTPPRILRQPSLRKLRAKVVIATAREIVFEVTIEKDFEWRPPASVLVVWADGASQSGVVDAGRTTGAGRVTIGQTVRLALRFDVDVPKDQLVVVQFGGVVAGEIIKLVLE
jgi:Ca-activated chloride channel family protein